MLNLTKWNNLKGLGPYYILEADSINAPMVNTIDKVRDKMVAKCFHNKIEN